jgi:hypothetical protein
VMVVVMTAGMTVVVISMMRVVVRVAHDVRS